MRAEIGALQAVLATGLPSVKPVSLDNVHVTVRFFGNLFESQVEAVGRALQKASSRCPALRLGIGGIGAFPNTRRPRTIWAGVARGARELTHLRETLDAALAADGFTEDAEGFVAHLTLARVRSPIGRADARLISRTIAGANQPRGPLAEFTVRHVTLMESTLSATGSIYRPLFIGALGKNEAQP